jgi:pimeloyl-ACP methyl ester carboxylesterase
VSASTREHLGWILHESGPPDAEHKALLLPGALCTAAFFEDVLADPRLAQAQVGFVTTTLPGFGGTPPLADLRMENDAQLAGRIASDLGCDVVVGHSLGGNVAIEMAAAGEFSGPLVLLSPSFSSEDEFKELRMINRIGRVPGVAQLAWFAMSKTISRAMKGSFPPARHDALVAEMQKNDWEFCRVKLREYFDYLDRQESLVRRLCDSGTTAWLAFGDHDDVGLTDDERRGLEGCPTLTMVAIADAGHMTLNDKPAKVAELILDAFAAAQR